MARLVSGDLTVRITYHDDVVRVARTLKNRRHPKAGR